MFEHRKAKLASAERFRGRLAKAILINLFILSFSLIIGILGYHYLANMRWMDSFLNASMILGGMGPVDALSNNNAKLFAGFYALFSGAIFLIGIGVVAAPILHRFMHRFHLDIDEEDKKEIPRKSS